MRFTFGDIVVVDGENIGVVVKSWGKSPNRRPVHHEVYVRMYNGIKEYNEDVMERYLVRPRYLSDEEKEYQTNAINT